MPYTPSSEVLERYADVLVNFALGGGTGIAAGDVVRIASPESGRPLYAALHRAVWRAGGHTISHYEPDDDAALNLTREFYELASDAQVDFFASDYWHGLIEAVDHNVNVIADADPHALEGVDPSLLMRTGLAMKPFIEWRVEKENAHRFSWTLGLYGTPAMAAEAGLTEEEYWEQIIGACFLDDPDPIARWRGSAAAGATSRASRSSRAPTGAAPRAGSPSTSRSTVTATSSAASAWSSPTGASRRPRRSRTSTC